MSAMTNRQSYEDQPHTSELVERAMDAYLLNNDLGGASPQVGDQIAGLVWSYIEQVIEEGVLPEVDQIVEEASVRAQEEIDEMLEQAWELEADVDDE